MIKIFYLLVFILLNIVAPAVIHERLLGISEIKYQANIDPYGGILSGVQERKSISINLLYIKGKDGNNQSVKNNCLTKNNINDD